MNLPNALTISRIFLAPFFFLAAFLPLWLGGGQLICYVILWILFLYIEISDVVDGYLARKLGLVSDLGKLLDPFSDVVSRLTYFVVFATQGIMPAWMLLVLLYRELGITFIRTILFNRGIAMAARRGGKLKAVLYAFAGGAGLLSMGASWFMLSKTVADIFTAGALTLFSLAVIVSIGSFVDYVIVSFRLYRGTVVEKGDSQ